MCSNSYKTYVNWSSGKDAAFTLYKLQQSSTYSIEHLVVSINQFHDRVSMHGLRRALLEKQISRLNLSYSAIELSENPSMDEYNFTMTDQVEKLKAKGFTHAAFGDIFLEDLRFYREKQLAPFGIECVFPLWKKNTDVLIKEFIDSGFKAITVCVQGDKLGKEFVGREIDHSFVRDLPAGVDPCGENGEFHTFCYDGPIFKEAVPFSKGKKVLRSYPAPNNDTELSFWYQDLIP